MLFRNSAQWLAAAGLILLGQAGVASRLPAQEPFPAAPSESAYLQPAYGDPAATPPAYSLPAHTQQVHGNLEYADIVLGGHPEDARIRAIVEQYFQEQEARRKAEEEAKQDAGYEVGTELGMTAHWNNGLELSTKNKDFRVHVGGRTQLDTSWYSVDQNLYAGGGPTAGLGNVYGDGIDFRRARLRVDGTMYETMEWAAEYDLIQGAPIGGSARALTAPTDLWWQFKEVPFVGNIRIGNQKEAIGFEHLVSSRFLPFMERSFNQDTFYGGLYNGFTPGISFFDTYGGDDEIGVWNVGIYKPTNNVFAFSTGDGDYAITGRLTRLLWYVEEGKGLVHVGLSGRQAAGVGTAVGAGATAADRSEVFRTRDAIRSGLATNWPTPANVTLFGDDLQWVNGEFVTVFGPLTFQSEYLVSGYQDARLTAAAAPVGTAVYHGGYVQLFYFLTGEHENYNKKTGTFDRVKPHENFFLVRDGNGCLCTGRGAWQIGARYNYLDLNDEGLNGGILHNFTGGLNWFLNPNMKMQFNYIATHRDAPLPGNTGDGWIHGWGMRVAHDF